MICAKCGTIIPEKWRYCAHCGWQIGKYMKSAPLPERYHRKDYQMVVEWDVDRSTHVKSAWHSGGKEHLIIYGRENAIHCFREIKKILRKYARISKEDRHRIEGR